MLDLLKKSAQDFVFATEMAGGQGGTRFEIHDRDYSPVLRLAAWGTSETIRGIEVSFRNNPSQAYLYGTRDGEHKEFVFNEGEYIVKGRCAPSGYRGGRCGWLEFDTSSGRHFDIGHWPNPGGEFQRTGTLVGLVGAAGADIDSLGLIFMEPIAKMELNNIRYELNSMDLNEVEQIFWLVLKNTKSIPQSVSGAYKTSHTESSTYSHSSTLKVGLKLGIKSGFIFQKGTIEFSVEGNWTWTWGSGSSNTKEITFNVNAAVEPKGSTYARAVVRTGAITVPYVADATLYFIDQRRTPEVWKDFRGTFYGVRAFEGEVEYRDERPEGTTPIDVTQSSKELTTA